MTTKKDKTPAEMTAEKVQDKSVQEDAATDMAKDAIRDKIALDTGTTPKEDEEEPRRRYQLEGTSGAEPLLEMGPEALEKAVDPKNDRPISEETIENALILERNGKNRTEYVKLLTKRLGMKPADIYKELPQAGGPAYTNDVTSLSDI